MQPAQIVDLPQEKRLYCSPEHRLAHWRTLIDVFFICGGVLFALMFASLLHDAMDGGWLLLSRLAWAAICLAAVISVVISGSASTSLQARNIVHVSLAIFLMSLTTVFVYIAAYRELLYNTEVQLTFIVVAAWAILGLGILSIEKRLLTKVSLDNAKPQRHWAVSIFVKLFASLLLTGIVFTFLEISMGYISLLGFRPISVHPFSSPFANNVAQWSVFLFVFASGVFCWFAMSTDQRNRIYPENIQADMHPYLLKIFGTAQVVTVILILLTFAVQGKHFVLVIQNVAFLAFSLWLHKKLMKAVEQKRIKEIATGTTFMT